MGIERNPRVQITVNDRQMELFRGMQVKHALNEEEWKLVQEKKCRIFDAEGNPVQLNKFLRDGDIFQVRKPRTDELYRPDLCIVIAADTPQDMARIRKPFSPFGYRIFTAKDMDIFYDLISKKRPHAVLATPRYIRMLDPGFLISTIFYRLLYEMACSGYTQLLNRYLIVPQNSQDGEVMHRSALIAVLRQGQKLRDEVKSRVDALIEMDSPPTQVRSKVVATIKRVERESPIDFLEGLTGRLPIDEALAIGEAIDTSHLGEISNFRGPGLRHSEDRD